ncbi:hypothetical protein [Palleronia rufa]|uniref:hypothetical protein n=1 Tax=Palleronia rufa TaxID=1530186 RepID=UPI0005666E7F|nr:hypothetical protein [Palleronia rufa]
MRSSRAALGAVLALCAGADASAQGEPLSAIDWLSDTVVTPVAMPASAAEGAEAPVARSARPEVVVIRPLDRPAPDLVGLSAAAARGLRGDLWSASIADTVARQVAELPTPRMPVSQDLLQAMLTVEAKPPRDSADGVGFFLTRLDALLALGAFDAARAMMERAGHEDPQIFRRWFDMTLLTGRENAACERMRALPEITPTYPARVFCLARSGEWPVAVVTLETGRALGVITAAETERLTRFLDDQAGGTALLPPVPPTPLDFMIYEAIGEPMGTQDLPLAFAHADLRGNTGWKPRIEAAERLARAGAISPGRLWQIYAEREPAASGGLWDRVEAAQRFDAALADEDLEAVSRILPAVWDAMRDVALGGVFAARYGAILAPMALTGQAKSAAQAAAILAGATDSLADPLPDGPLAAIVAGGAPDPDDPDPVLAAITAGLTAKEVPDTVAAMLGDGRTAEALIFAIELLEQGAAGNLDAASDALAILRRAGQADRARRAALELLLLAPA